MIDFSLAEFITRNPLKDCRFLCYFDRCMGGLGDRAESRSYLHKSETAYNSQMVPTNSLAFTEYVRALELSTEPPIEIFDAAEKKLSQSLKKEMVKRGLWNLPPTYLGIYGYGSWSNRDAFEDLLNDCYLFIFAQRLSGLKSLLETQENIEGVIYRSIRHFLFEKQKNFDPLGYKIFIMLQAAIRRAVDVGFFYVTSGSLKISNETLVRTSSKQNNVGAESTYTPEFLEELVDEWNTELLPELLTAQGKRVPKIVEELCILLSSLPDRGVEVFCFKDLVDPLKKNARARWGGEWFDSQGEMAFEESHDGFAELVSLVRPNVSLAERQVFKALLDCVAESLAHLSTSEKTHIDLERLWMFIRQYAAEDSGCGEGFEAEEWPSQRKIEMILEIPRQRLPELHESLGRLVTACKESQGAAI